MSHRKLRMGMIGGGIGAFISGVHRIGANLDGQRESVCGAFGADPGKSKASGKDLFLARDLVYDSFHEMIRKEGELPADRQMDFVPVAPNVMHYEPEMLALNSGFPVIIDKPLIFNIGQALELRQKVRQCEFPFAVTRTYTGNPMVKQLGMAMIDAVVSFSRNGNKWTKV